MVDVVLTGSKKLAKLKATLTLEGTMAHINFDVSSTDMKDEATLLKKLKEYQLVTTPKPPETVTTSTSIRTTPVIMDSNEAVTAPTTVNAIDAAVVTPPP